MPRKPLPIRDLFSDLLSDSLSESLSESPPQNPAPATEEMNMPPTEMLLTEPEPIEADDKAPIFEARLWSDRGWTARVMKNEEDEGWAVAMFQDGESEPALVGPWTMGRDKKNPKPLDVNAFNTLVKTANEVLRRHQQQLHAQLHKTLNVNTPESDLRITLDIVPDEEHPYGVLSAFDGDGNELAKVRVAASFKLDLKSAWRWIENDFCKPG